MNAAGRPCPVSGAWEFALGRKRDSYIDTRSYHSRYSRREAPGRKRSQRIRLSQAGQGSFSGEGAKKQEGLPGL